MTLSDSEAKSRAPASGGWQPPNLAPARPKAVDTTERDLKQLRDEAYKAGYAEGLAAGRARGEAVIGEMNALLQAMAVPFRSAEGELLADVVALVERAIRAILNRELDAGAYDLEGILGEALGVLGSVTVPVELRLHPADAAAVRDFGLVPDTPIEITEDRGVSRGGVRLRAGSSVVDASLETRLAEIFTELRASAGLPAPEPDDLVLEPAPSAQDPVEEEPATPGTAGSREQEP